MSNNREKVFGTKKNGDLCNGCYLADKFMDGTDESALCALFERLTTALFLMLPDGEDKDKAIMAMHEMVCCACQAVDPEE